MGFSFTKAAGDTLNNMIVVLRSTTQHSRHKIGAPMEPETTNSWNQFERQPSHLARHDAQGRLTLTPRAVFKEERFWERGRENRDGAITGEIFALGHHACRKVGTFRINAEGKVVRWPGTNKWQRELAERHNCFSMSDPLFRLENPR